MFESLINKVACLKAGNFIKERLQHRCFSVNIANFLRTPILKNICKLLFLVKVVLVFKTVNFSRAPDTLEKESVHDEPLLYLMNALDII